MQRSPTNLGDFMDNEQLFDLAVQKIRRGTRYVELISELEEEAIAGTDVRELISRAGAYVETFQAESLAAAVSAAKQGMSHFEIAKRLRSLGFQSFDADVLAQRSLIKAQDEADAEAKGNLDKGLTALGGKTE
jgi:hypothetical protein